MKKHIIFLFALFSILVLVGCNSQSGSTEESADYPADDINIIVPYAPGGNMDVTGRIIGEHAPKYFEENKFIIQNKEGGGAAIGDEYVANADPEMGIPYY